jgi:hypothetical protein
MALVGMTEVRAERPPSCDNCGRATVKVGKLSRLGSHPLIHVYKCQPCRQIISITSVPFGRAPKKANEISASPGASDENASANTRPSTLQTDGQ